MFKKSLYILGSAALVYLFYYTVSESVKRKEMTELFIEATNEICLPLFAQKEQVTHPKFRKKVSEKIPEDFVIKDQRVSERNGDRCAQFKVSKTDSPVNISLCKNSNDEFRCRIGATSKPMQLNEGMYINSAGDFSKWNHFTPDNVTNKSKSSTTVSKIICNPSIKEKGVNPVEISQRSGLHVVHVILKQKTCKIGQS